jgi:Cu+-exporting ATPase
MEFIFYETSLMLASFLMIGRFLEARAKGRTSDAIKKLIGLQAKTAVVVRDGEEMEVPVEDVEVGDIVVVRPGEKVPADGIVSQGEGYVDESMITGEPIPNLKKPGDEVVGGTINKDRLLRFEANRVGRDTLLQQIIRMVEEAQGSKPQIQKLADKVVTWFIPVILIIAIVSFIVWYIVPPCSPPRCSSPSWSSLAPAPWAWPHPPPSQWAWDVELSWACWSRPGTPWRSPTALPPWSSTRRAP